MDKLMRPESTTSTRATGLAAWLRWLTLVALFVVAASGLSIWQFERRAEKVAEIQLIQKNYDAPPVPLAKISWEKSSDGSLVDEWRIAEVRGEYLTDRTWLIRNRPLNGSAGYLVVAPLLLSDGRILAVERGWLATGESGGEPTSLPALASGEREVLVRLRPSESAPAAPSDSGTLGALNLFYLAGELTDSGEVITQFYGRLAAESPPDQSYPKSLPKPSLSEGNHLSYALQWILFALMAISALVWAIRRERMILKGSLSPITSGRVAREDAAAEDLD